MRGFKTNSKEIRRSLKRLIQPRPGANLLPKRKKSGRPIAHRESSRCASDRWLKTIQDSKPKTLEQKSYIADRIKKQWPTGSLVQVAKIKPSDCDLWMARCAQKSRNGFSASSRNAHVQILKEVFAVALRDKIISDSPAAIEIYQSARNRFD